VLDDVGEVAAREDMGEGVPGGVDLVEDAPGDGHRDASAVRVEEG
jgi:hypothetical protein